MNYRNLAILLVLLFLSLALTEYLRFLLPAFHPLLYLLLAILIFSLVFMLFDRYLWRWFGMGKQVDFHGDWLGRLNTSRSDNSNVEEIRVLIKQHWLTSHVDFIAPHSRSVSLAAVFYEDKDGKPALAYIYKSKPYEGKEHIVLPHVGLNIFYQREAGKLVGYFHHLEADEDGVRFTHGQVVLTRPNSVS